MKMRPELAGSGWITLSTTVRVNRRHDAAPLIVSAAAQLRVTPGETEERMLDLRDPSAAALLTGLPSQPLNSTARTTFKIIP